MANGEDAFLQNAYEELRSAQGDASYFLKLLPPTLRHPAGRLFPEDCPLEQMRAALATCRDIPAKCACVICTEQVGSGYYQKLPEGCTDTRRNLLSQVLIQLSAEFDDSRYSPGDIGRLLTGRFRAALAQRKQQRNAARSVVRKSLIADHRFAQQKKTARLQGLRDSMGDAAFERMVAQQVEARRARGNEDAQARAEAYRWWNSAEGRWYHRGPPAPDSRIVGPFLEPRPGCLQRQAAPLGTDLLEGQAPTPLENTLENPPGNPMENPRAAFLAPGAATPDVVLDVPRHMVAKCAAAIQDWNQVRVSHFHHASCSATIKVNFEGSAGERVPRVHLTARPAEPLVVMDAASLENLRDGDLLGGILRLVRVGGRHPYPPNQEPDPDCLHEGRVVAVTGSEAVAVALPRPHDRFDQELRGPHPPSSRLPVGWDVTQAASEATLVVSWPFSSKPALTIRLLGSEALEELNPHDFNDRINSLFHEMYEVSHRRYKLVEDTLFFAPRSLMRSLDLVYDISKKASRCGYDYWMKVYSPLRDLVVRSWSWCREHALEPATGWVARQWTRLLEEAVHPAWDCLSNLMRSFLSALGRCGRGTLDNVLAPAWRGLYNNVLEPVGTTLHRCLTAATRPLRDAVRYVSRCLWRAASTVTSAIVDKVSSAARSLAACCSDFWAADPWPRRCFRYVDELLGSVADAVSGAFAKVGQTFSDLWHSFFPEPQPEQVHLTRVRQRHEFHVR